MAILLNNHGYDNAPWAEALQRLLPHLPIFEYPSIERIEDIEYAVVWHHPHGDLLRYPNLKAVLVLGAGTDHIDQEPELPRAPIVRLVDPDVGNDMAQYAVYWTMHFHRKYELYRQQQAQQLWIRHKAARAQDYRVSVLGLGRIGQFIAQRIAANGFAAQAWSRSEYAVENVACFSGGEGLSEMLQQTEVLINCLPLNDQTHHFLDQQRFGLLPQGASFINVSRGAVVDDDALIAALENQQIYAAVLDTFDHEPLAADSRYWHMQNVYITPHISGATYARSAAKAIADNITRIENGQAPFPIHSPQ